MEEETDKEVIKDVPTEVYLAFKERWKSKKVTWLDRCATRVKSGAIRRSKTNEYTVDGSEELHDTYMEYTVRYVPHQKKYKCSCQEHSYGDIRQRMVCSHIGAVILRNMVYFHFRQAGELKDNSSFVPLANSPKNL